MAGAARRSENEFKFSNGQVLETYVGDITQAKADVLVVPEGVYFRGLGYIGRQMMELSPKFRKNREKLKTEKPLAAWDVYTSTLGGKRFKHVIHAIVVPCPDSDLEEWSNKMHLLYQRIFQEANRKMATVLAVPLLGTEIADELKKLKDVARKKGFTVKESDSGQDLLTALSDQLSYVLREEIDPGHLRTVVARYLRTQSDNESNLINFLIGTRIEDVITSLEKGGNVGFQIFPYAATNIFGVEIVLTTVSGDEIVFQPFRDKEFLPLLVLGTISNTRFFSLERETAGFVATDIPSTWSRSSKHTELVTLQPHSQEYKEVEQSFFRSIGKSKNHIVIQIKRVQSITQWKCYKIIRDQMVQRYPDTSTERLLWHGTSEAAIKPICKEGFNRSHCGKNATRYGSGVYFSKASSCAAEDTYSVPSPEGFKFVFRARVLTGQYIKGESGMKVTPWLDEKELERFDSVVDNVDRPSLFVIFHDNKAYPEYLIKFR